MKIKPLNKRVVVQKEQKINKIGSILLPDEIEASQNKGTIVAINDSTDCEVKVGDIVIFNSFAGISIPNDDTLMLLKEEDIIGVVE